MERSRNLILTKWTQANDSLFKYFEGNKSKLTKHLKMSRTTVTNFFGEKPVRESEFRKICLALRLNWEDVSKVEGIDNQQENEQGNDTDTLTLIQKIRDHCNQKILNQHSRMRLLNGNEIGVDQLYVDVWLLDRPEHKLYKSPENLLKVFDIQNDRLALAKRLGDRKRGFEVANAKTKLVILGKPGAGKTTFLKHLAVDSCKGKFQSGLIAVLIEFRRIRDGQWGLMYAIEKELGLENWSQIQEIEQQLSDLGKKKLKETEQEKQSTEKEIQTLKQKLESLPLQTLLKQGKLLVLMDGLDEVPTSQLRGRVQSQLCQVVEDYPNNQFILTSRTQIIESIPVGFTSVEVADFSPEQIKQFVQNWFTASGKLNAEVVKQCEMFDNAVGKNPALQELTVTPVLLSLMCLVWQDEGEMPSQVDWLYQKGIKLLLSKWNDAKAIDGWEVGTETYGQLSIEQKEALLMAIAAHKFENPNNFVLFEQEEITNQIANFLQLTNPKEKVAVLKAIEAQHGLLIERADELWSFSHLTFQEHFTIRWLTQLPSEKLVEKITNQRWQEVVKQLVKSQQPADRLVRLIKQAIDQFIKSEPKLQKFLIWVLEKSGSISANHKFAAIHRFYFSLASFTTANLDRALHHVLTLIHDHNLDRDIKRDIDRERKRDRALALDHALTKALVHALTLDHALTKTLDRALDLTLDSELTNRLEKLREVLPTLSTENQDFLQWWQANGNRWSEQLRQVMMEHRNIGYDWQFSDAQKQQLQRYYDANEFLVDLMGIEGAVSNTIRSEIEDTLLLPWEELQCRQRYTVRSNLLNGEK